MNTPFGNARIAVAAALGLVVVVAIGAVLLLRGHPGPAPIRLTPPKAVPAAPPSPRAVPDCLLPGPPPVPPDGNTANAADMKLGHDVIQAFVLQLEAYQSCRNSQVDHASPQTSAQQKQTWLDQGNAAVDEADALAAAFSTQLKAYHARIDAPAARP